MWAAYTVSMRRAGLLPLTAASVVCVASLVFYVPVWALAGGPGRLLAAYLATCCSRRSTNRCFPRSVAIHGIAHFQQPTTILLPIAESSDW